MHSILNTIHSLQQSNNQASSAHTTKILAENIFKDLKSYGLRDKDIVAVSSEILNRLTNDIRARSAVSDSESAFDHVRS